MVTRYAIKELTHKEWLVKYCYTEFTSDISHATMFKTFKEAKEFVKMCRQELSQDYKYNIYTVRIEAFPVKKTLI